MFHRSIIKNDGNAHKEILVQMLKSLIQEVGFKLSKR